MNEISKRPINKLTKLKLKPQVNEKVTRCIIYVYVEEQVRYLQGFNLQVR